MPGAEDENKNQNPSGTEDPKKEGGSGSQENLTEDIQSLKDQIKELRKEAAKYRTKAKEKESNPGDMTLEQQIAKLTQEIENTKRENVTVKRVAVLEKMGCIEADLIASKIPDDETDVKGWAEDYKKSHPSLFEEKKPQSHGGGYKPSNGSKVESFGSLFNSALRNT